jgi:hypothetical protein
VPDSANPAAAAPDLAGALLSIAGLGLVLWPLIEAPVHGWSSALVIGAGLGGLAVLAVFGAWEQASKHPMLNLGFFRRRQFSAAISSVGLVTFGLIGALFVLTRWPWPAACSRSWRCPPARPLNGTPMNGRALGGASQDCELLATKGPIADPA